MTKRAPRSTVFVLGVLRGDKYGKSNANKGRRRKTGVENRNERRVSRLATWRRSRVLLQPEKLIASRETRRQRVLSCTGYVGAGMSGCGSRNTIILHASKCTNVGKFNALFNESRDESKSASPVETPEPVAATNRFDGNGIRSRFPRTARQESLPGSVTAPTNCSTIRISRRVQRLVASNFGKLKFSSGARRASQSPRPAWLFVRDQKETESSGTKVARYLRSGYRRFSSLLRLLTLQFA